MSHFAVAVLHTEDQDIEDLLAPYSEELRVAPYVAYTKEQAIKYAREHFTKMENATDEECYKEMVEEYEGRVDKDGNILSVYNPDSKWDWYEVGGRWSYMLRLKNDKGIRPFDTDDIDGDLIDELCTNEALVSDVDFTPNNKVYRHCLRWWDVIIDGKPLEEGDEPFTEPFYKKEYFVQRYKNRETYAKAQAGFSTYAVITPDGVWHAPGDIGWFGCSTETDDEYIDWTDHYMERFIDSAEPGTIITIVDCHI